MTTLDPARGASIPGTAIPDVKSQPIQKLSLFALTAMVGRQHAVRQHRYEHEQTQHAEEADDRGYADVGTVFRVPGIDARALPTNTKTVTSMASLTWAARPAGTGAGVRRAAITIASVPT